MEASLPPALGTDTDISAAVHWMHLLEALHCCLWELDVALVLPPLTPGCILSGAVNLTGTIENMCP